MTKDQQTKMLTLHEHIKQRLWVDYYKASRDLGAEPNDYISMLATAAFDFITSMAETCGKTTEQGRQLAADMFTDAALMLGDIKDETNN